MLVRCYNSNTNNYHNYGGRGIRVCDRWRGKSGFESFVNDMGNKPTPKHTLDRKNTNKDYSPSNCQWETRDRQNQNRRRFDLNTSGVTGVYFFKRDGIWTAAICVNSKLVHLGRFKDKHEAIIARLNAEKLYWGKA